MLDELARRGADGERVTAAEAPAALSPEERESLRAQ